MTEVQYVSKNNNLRLIVTEMVLTRQGRQVSNSALPFLPLFLRAAVVKGMRRGGKELGIPTGMT